MNDERKGYTGTLKNAPAQAPGVPPRALKSLAEKAKDIAGGK